MSWRFSSLQTLAFVAAVTAACAPSDATLQNTTRTRLAEDPATRDLELTVEVKQGVVRLSGDTRTRAQQDRAAAIARNVDGVRDVIDEMRNSREILIRAVRDALAADALVASVPLDIEAEGGSVILKSSQTNQEQRDRIVKIARSVQGVTAVEDQMK